jgi:hypothetical protein
MEGTTTAATAVARPRRAVTTMTVVAVTMTAVGVDTTTAVVGTTIVAVRTTTAGTTAPVVAHVRALARHRAVVTTVVALRRRVATMTTAAVQGTMTAGPRPRPPGLKTVGMTAAGATAVVGRTLTAGATTVGTSGWTTARRAVTTAPRVAPTATLATRVEQPVTA